jgi:hypothetical protein
MVSSGAVAVGDCGGIGVLFYEWSVLLYLQ